MVDTRYSGRAAMFQSRRARREDSDGLLRQLRHCKLPCFNLDAREGRILTYDGYATLSYVLDVSISTREKGGF